MTPPLPHPAPTPKPLRADHHTSFDPARYGAAVDWTPRSFLIDGVPRAIIAAEFHYFRVPDRARWRPLLQAIRAAGFNAVRFYIHWGYHSPAEGVLDFEGNRDIAHLFDLCEELHLFAIPAPGPYICAEVQCGGYPLWLVAKRDLRIRHLTNPPVGLRKRWDQAFHEYCANYFRKVLSIIVPHERTTNPDGCVIAMQLENELRSKVAGLVGGLNDEICQLAMLARAAGSTVPFFHNDDSPVGSWAAGLPQREPRSAFRRTGPLEYRTDLYGFDLYFTFPPGDKSGDMSSCQLDMIEVGGVSACLNFCGVGGAGVGGADTQCLSCLYTPDTVRSAPPPELAWVAAGQMSAGADGLEATMASIGGSAASAPPFIAETQVGWINQWGRLRGYDEIYSFFGNHFSSTLLVTLMAQGISMSNHYMSYGGTNHGAMGDTEVYSSYDYSAFIREFGMLSMRGRRMRLSAFFLRTFASRGLANTERVSDVLSSGFARGTRRFARKSKNATRNRVKTTVAKSLISVREVVLPTDSNFMSVAQAVVDQPPMFAFLRNLEGGSGRFNLIVDDVPVPCFLPLCDAMIAPLYFPLGPADRVDATVFACTVPVIARGEYGGCELWVLRTRESEKGRLILQLPESLDFSGMLVRYATLPSSASGAEVGDEDNNPAVSGMLRASSRDHGAATSILAAPLEELGLEHWSPFGDTSPPVAVRVSTEPVGMCFWMAFAGRRDACVVSVHDASTDARSNSPPLLRLVCLSDTDADTFTADCCGSDPYVSPRGNSRLEAEIDRPLSVAWGADELGFMPNGVLNLAYSVGRKTRVYVLRADSTSPTRRRARESLSEELVPVNRRSVTEVIQGLSEYVVHGDEVAHALVVSKPSRRGAVRKSSPNADPLRISYELPCDGWERRVVDWSEVDWKPISYDNIDPLDHLFCGGHVVYRVRFRTTARKATMVTNIRHVAAIWCNGVAVGSQVVFSHNAASAGAMHAVDVHRAGKQRHNLSPGLAAIAPEAEGVHEVVILVLSFGQGRSPFLLNDVRNKRGLLSARFTRSARFTDVEWEIAGVDVRKLSNAYQTAGLPLEDVVNDKNRVGGFALARAGPAICANDGIVYYRTTFSVPACSVVGGDVRYPIRIRVDTCRRAVVIMWVNGFQIGRYVEATGPQSDFYVPAGLIVEPKNNMLVVAVYGAVDGECSVRVLPWVVDPVSGNLNPQAGEVFALREAAIALGSRKP